MAGGESPMMTLKKGSYRTTAAGVVLAIAAFFTVAGAMFDDDASTSPDWNLVVLEAVAAFGFISARDARA